MDPRRHERFDALIDTEVRCVSGLRYPATILNLSVGGAAVGVDSWEGGDFAELSVMRVARQHWLACELRHVETMWRRTILHLQFRQVTRDQGDAIDMLLVELKRNRDIARGEEDAA